MTSILPLLIYGKHSFSFSCLMSRILVSGSIATDVIMNFHDQFGKYVLPEKTHKLSVNFNINHLVRHPGGAGHNIAYNLALL